MKGLSINQYENRSNYHDCCHTPCRSCSAAPGLAGLVVDRASHGALDRTQLRRSDHPGERNADRSGSGFHPCTDRAGLVAGAGALGVDADPAAQGVAGGDDPLHAVALTDLEFGDQRCVPGWGYPNTATALRDLPTGYYRHANHVAV